jgi:hypothetical protein
MIRLLVRSCAPKRLFLIGLLLFASASLHAQETFRILVICKPSYDIPTLGKGQMTPAQIEKARVAFTQTFPKMIRDHTGNQIAVDVTFVVLPRTFKSLWRTRDPLKAYKDNDAVWPEDLPADDIKEYLGEFARGWYDHVVNYNAYPKWQLLTSGWFTSPADVSWSSLQIREDMGYNQDGQAGIWHEWLHGWEAYYYHLKKFPNKEAWLHYNVSFGYDQNYGGLPHTLAWYRDLSLGIAKDASNLQRPGNFGFGPAAWAPLGTPRSRYKDNAPALVDGAYYRIESRTSSRQLDIEYALQADGGNLLQWAHGGQPHSTNSEFRLEDAKNGYYYLRARHSDKVLQAPPANNTDGARIQQWTHNGGTHQQWQITYAGSGHFRLKNRLTNKYLDVGGSVAEGAPVVQRGGYSDTAEQFRFIRIP